MAYSPEETQGMWDAWANELVEQSPDFAESLVRSMIECDVEVKEQPETLA